MIDFEFPEFEDLNSTEDMLILFEIDPYEIRNKPIGYKKVISFYNGINGHVHVGRVFKSSESTVDYEILDDETRLDLEFSLQHLDRNFLDKGTISLSTGEIEGQIEIAIESFVLSKRKSNLPFKESGIDQNGWIRVIPQNQKIIQERNRIIKEIRANKLID